MTIPPFDYGPIRQVAFDLIKSFARQSQCAILRPREAAPADPTKPWRLGAPVAIRSFPFLGVVSTLGFPKRSDPVTDRDIDVTAAGDLTLTPDIGDPTTLCGIPTTADRIQVNTLGINYQYQIMGVQDVTPDSKCILLKMRAKLWPSIIGQPGTYL